MKQVSAALDAHLQSEVTTLSTCWKLVRRDSLVLGFTDHDRDIVFESVTYKASSGFTPSAIVNSATFSVDNMDVEGMLTSGLITETDILAGKYDFAALEIFQVNHADITQGALKLKRGWIGEISLRKQQFVAEVRGLAQRLSQTIGEMYSPSCRATLGDTKCKVNLASHTVTGSVTTIVSNQEFRDSSRSEATGIFNLGTLTFTNGANNGLSMEVKEYSYAAGSGGLVTLALPMPFLIAPGDTYSMVKGCDKTLVTCHSRYSNVVNFRGEPHVPGFDRILETAGTRSNW